MNNEELQCMWFVKGAWGADCRQISFLIFDFVWEQGLIFNYAKSAQVLNYATAAQVLNYAKSAAAVCRSSSS